MGFVQENIQPSVQMFKSKSKMTMSEEQIVALFASCDAEMEGPVGSWSRNEQLPMVVDDAFAKWWENAQAEVWAKTAHLRQGETPEQRLAREERAAESAEGCASLTAEWASEDYWWSKRCTCTEEELDNHNGGGPISVTCACYKKVKLDETGEPQECRFFNSPAGCRDGADCVYQHKKRDPATMPCRFELSPVGCNPGFGRKCPYMHSKEPTATETIVCRFDGRCKPPPGATCPYKHTAQTVSGSWRCSSAAAAAAGAAAAAPTSSNSWSRSAGGSSSSAGAARTSSKSDTPCSFGSRCNPRGGKPCPFKH